MNILADIFIALPEVFLALSAIVLLMIGVFRGESSTRLVLSLSVVALVATAALLVLSLIHI